MPGPDGLEKARLSQEEILERIVDVWRSCPRATSGSSWHAERSEGGGWRQCLRHRTDLEATFTRQVYLPAVFEFEDDEALILETELPTARRYWNFQLNDPYFNASRIRLPTVRTNGHFAKVSVGRQAARSDFAAPIPASPTGSIRRASSRVPSMGAGTTATPDRRRSSSASRWPSCVRICRPTRPW